MSLCEILPFLSPDAEPMRRDQRAYDSVTDRYSVRFYRWCEPMVSIGRFQTLSPEFLARLAAHNIPWIRRPTGGQAILHQGDLTFSIVGPLPEGQAHHLLQTYHHIAQGLITGLASLNITAKTVSHEPVHKVIKNRPDACYGFTSQADLRVNDQKFIGCAQVRRRRAFLQQGVVYLEAPHALHKALFQAEVPIADLKGLTGHYLAPERVVEALGEGLKHQLMRPLS